MQLVLYKDSKSVFKKIWAIPELKHLYWARCEMKGPFLALYLKVNKVERCAIYNFKSVRVCEKQSGKLLFEVKDIVGDVLGTSQAVKVEDEICIVRRVKQIAENQVSIIGVYTAMARDEQLVDVEFVTSAGLTISEDSLDCSMSFNVEVDAVELGASRASTP